MDGWNWAILAIAAYVAVMSLTRLMLRRRNEKMAQFRREVEKESRRRAADRASRRGA